MDSQLVMPIVGLISGITALAGAATAFIKQHTQIARQKAELDKVKADRSSTGERRDRENQEVHDMLLRHSFEIQHIKDTQSHHIEVVRDVQDTCSVLNTNVAKLSVVVENLAEIVKEMKAK